MKKKISIIAVLAIIVLLLSAGSVFADLEVDSPALIAPAPVSEEILTEDEITNMVTTELITARTKTSSDVYKADQNVNLKGEEVSGNVYIAGKEVVVEDELIYGDLFVAAQRIEIKDSARINGNVFLAGQDIFMNGTVDRTIYAAGANVELGKTSIVGYSGYLAGNNVIAKGMVTRDLSVGTTSLKVESTATVLGTLRYSSDTEGEISRDAKLGKVNYSKVQTKERTTWDIVTDYILDFAENMVYVMLILIFAIKLAPNFVQRTMEKVSFGSFGIGLLWFIVVPAIFVCLLMLRVTAGFDLVVLLLYLLGIVLSNAIACMAIGKQIEEAHEKIKLPLATALVATISWIIFQIPFVGGLISCVYHLLGFGILLRATFANVPKEIKADK